jgi:TPP-dependent indolepyruvate ferredoxin oxidoreductase alpha subunit
MSASNPDGTAEKTLLKMQDKALKTVMNLGKNEETALETVLTAARITAMIELKTVSIALKTEWKTEETAWTNDSKFNYKI